MYQGKMQNSGKKLHIIYLFRGLLIRKRKHTKKKDDTNINESAFFSILKKEMISCMKEEYALKYFRKNRGMRTDLETRVVAEYMAMDEKNIFFNYLFKKSRMKLYNMVNRLSIEQYKKGDIIFQRKEIINKFYIIFKGTVSLCLPYFAKVHRTIKEFLDYFYFIKIKFPKSLVRIAKKNETQLDNIIELKGNEYKLKNLNEINTDDEKDFYVESFQKLYELHQGEQINQLSMSYNLRQNYNCHAETDVYLLHMTKNDFFNILRHCIEEDLSKEFSKLRKYCYIFNSWGNHHLAQINQFFIPMQFIKEETLYNQKESSDAFYIVQEGIFEAYCEISVSEFLLYKKYITHKEQNIFEWVKDNKSYNIETIFEFLNWKNSNEKYPQEKEIINQNTVMLKKKFFENEENKNNIIRLKIDEEILKDKGRKVVIKLFTLTNNDFIGFEDSFQFKKRFYSVKCVSKRGIVNKIRILDFIILLITNHSLDFKQAKYLINERNKQILERLYNVLGREIKNNIKDLNHFYSIALSNFENKHNIDSDNNFENKKDNYINYQIKSNLIEAKRPFSSIPLNNSTNKNSKFVSPKFRLDINTQNINNLDKINLNQQNKSFHKETLQNEKNNHNTVANKSTSIDNSMNLMYSSNYRNKSRKIKRLVNTISINNYQQSLNNPQKRKYIYPKNYSENKSSRYSLIDKKVMNIIGIYNTKREVSKYNTIYSYNKLISPNLKENTNITTKFRVKNNSHKVSFLPFSKISKGFFMKKKNNYPLFLKSKMYKDYQYYK